MKKCLCTFFICLFIFILNFDVYAYCFNIEGKTLEVKNFYKYKYYRNEEIFKYFKKGENTKDYPNFIENDIKESIYSNWSFTKEEKKDRIYEQRLVYAYKEINDIRYIFLKDFKGGYDRLYISEIKLYNNNKEIPYEVECKGCSKDFSKYIKNGVLGENKSYASKDAIVKLEIDNSKNLNDIEFHIYMYDEIDTEKHFKLIASHNDDIEDVYYEDEFTYYFHSSNDEDVRMEIIKLSDLSKINPKYGEEKISLEPIEENDNIKVEEKLQYRYKDILYKYKGLKRIYSNDYLDNETKEFPIIDKDKKKEYEMCIWKDIDRNEEDIKKIVPKENNLNSKELDNKIVEVDDIEFTKGYEKISNISCKLEKENINTLNKELLKCKKEKTFSLYLPLLIIFLLIIYIICQKKKKENNS